jgi:hypothetical protein
MSVEKNPTKIADSAEEFETVSKRSIVKDPYKNINDIIDMIELLIDKRKQKDKEVS